jgi:hypothetical protein
MAISITGQLDIDKVKPRHRPHPQNRAKPHRHRQARKRQDIASSIG